MVQVLDRPEVREHEGDTLLHEAPRHIEAPTAPPEIHRPTEPEVRTPAPKRPIRWMRWLAVALILVVGVGVAVVFLGGESSDTPESLVGDFKTADYYEHVLTPQRSLVGDFKTADYYEHVLTPAVSLVGDFKTADYYEHVLTQTPEVAEFHTADWYEHMVTGEPTVSEFHTADWYEHMLEV